MGRERRIAVPGGRSATGRTRSVRLRRLLTTLVGDLDYGTQRRWLLLLATTGVLFSASAVGLLIILVRGTLTAPVAYLTGVAITGYGTSLGFLLHRRSHVLPSHVLLSTMTISVVSIIVVTEQPWLFAPVLGTLIPILAVQLLGRRPALVWTSIAGACLVVIITAVLTEAWVAEPAPFLGREEIDQAFIAACLPVMLLVFVWFHEGTRSHEELASSFKSAVLASMSHELRTPLNGVLGMLEDVLGDQLSPQQRERLVMAHQSGTSLLDIVDDALDLLQAEAGHLAVAHEAFDLRAGLQTLVEHHVARGERPQVEVSLSYPEVLPSWFLGDGRKVLRVAGKLVDNGLKFTDRGYVRIQVERSAATDEGESMLTIRVEDTGIGIPADKLGVIFDELTKLEDSWDRTRGGTGMGLAVCRELVTAMGGQVGVQSEEGQGSTLWFSLPLAVAPVPEVEPAEEARVPTEAPSRPLRILVVEDNTINQLVARRMLERLGCEVEVVSDGQQAVDRVRTLHFDLVFMDVQMPVMDGFQATAAIREASDEEIASLPVVAMTAFTMAGDRARCLDAGMNGYVGKPIDRERVVSELRRLTPWGDVSSVA